MAAICGIDWALEFHDVRVCDDADATLAERRIAHTEAGIGELLELLREHDVDVAAIERPDGLLVGRLLAAGVNVMAIHANQVAAARDRFRAAAGKADRFDAMVLSELARTDAHRFALLAACSDDTLALRALVGSREELVGARVALANQLRAHLAVAWPGAARIFADIDSPIGLAFLERYRSPHDARGLGPKRLGAFLARNAYCGRRTPTHLLKQLNSAPNPAIGTAHAEAHRTAVLALIAALKPIVEEISRLTSEIAATVRAHPDGPIFLSFFRDPKSVICAAGLLAEIGDNRARYRTPDALAADASMAPVAKESGKRRHATFRWACDKRLRNHFCVLADATRHRHPWARDVYTRARARGADHPHALRILGRAWSRVLFRCWHDHQPYNPQLHGNLNRLLTQPG